MARNPAPAAPRSTRGGNRHLLPFDGEECVYVGQSRQVHTRVREHRARRKGQFTSYAWVSCRLDELDALEREYIELLQPPLNAMWTFERHRAQYDRSTTQAK